MGSADKQFAGFKRRGSQAEVQSVGEFLRAAKEALTEAGTNLNDENYEESIAESKEALRLAQVVAEKTGTAIAERNTDTTSPEGWKKYTVKKRRPADTLWRISGLRENYGNPFLWKRIYQANQDKIKNPNLIYPGQVFDIPPKTGPITKPEKEEVEDMDSSDSTDMDRESVE